jgi:ferredoxin-NADP reductase
MLERALAAPNRWALEAIGRDRVDYLVSNTMTELNRKLNGFVWTYELKAQVVRVIDEAPGVKTYVVRPNQHWRGFKAGQHVEVSLNIDGEVVPRHYSISPLPNGRFSFTVKRVEGGKASGWIHQHLRAGTVLKIGHAQGRFCRDVNSSGKALYLVAGSGITPCHSMVNDLLRKAPAQAQDLQVITQFKSGAEVIFAQTLQRWAQAGVKVHTAFSQGSATGQSLPGVSSSARLDANMLVAQCPDIASREVYLCGPDGFMQAMMGHLQALGVDAKRIHTERFSFASDAASPDANFQAEGAEVYFQHLDTRVTLTAADQGKTLLQIAQDHGVPVESGCCQGMCGTCRLVAHEGQVSGNALGKVVYLCTAYPASRSLVLDT